MADYRHNGKGGHEGQDGQPSGLGAHGAASRTADSPARLNDELVATFERRQRLTHGLHRGSRLEAQHHRRGDDSYVLLQEYSREQGHWGRVVQLRRTADDAHQLSVERWPGPLGVDLSRFDLILGEADERDVVADAEVMGVEER